MDAIAATELYSLQKHRALNLIDVRTMREFAAGHVPGARSVPLDVLTVDAVRAAGITSISAPLYVICAAGGRSATACGLLERAGLTVVNVIGGTNAWRAAGLPLERQAGTTADAASAPPCAPTRASRPWFRIAGLLAAVAALVLGLIVHPAFAWLAAALWVALLVSGKGACPMCVLLPGQPKQTPTTEHR